MEKLKAKQKIQLTELLGSLLDNGFSLPEALNFLAKTNGIKAEWLQLMTKNLAAGNLLAQSFAELQFSADQVLQIELAETHGSLAKTLQGIAKQLQLSTKQKENFFKVLAYPAVLILFLMITLLSMRYFLLPQLLATGLLAKSNWAVVMIQFLPFGVLLLVLLSLVGGVVWRIKMGQQTLIARYSLLAKLPVLGKIQQDYYSAYFALEWGKLFVQGLELNQIINCILVTKKPSLMKELAIELQLQFQQGRPLAMALRKYSFLSPEFSQIIDQGEVRGQLGIELLTYSEMIWQRFFNRIELISAWLQPAIFLVVALLIVSLYVAMLLPLSGNLGGVL